MNVWICFYRFLRIELECGDVIIYKRWLFWIEGEDILDVY